MSVKLETIRSGIDPRRLPVGASGLVVLVAALIAFSSLLLSGLHVGAQTNSDPEPFLVSNTGQTLDTTGFSRIGFIGPGNLWATSFTFTTGTTSTTDSRGARISEVDLPLGTEGVKSAATFQVSLYSTTVDSDNLVIPHNSLFVFDNPSSFTNDAINTFTVPDSAGTAATVAANTTYAIVLETTATAQNANNQVHLITLFRMMRIPEGRDGWSIGDTGVIINTANPTPAWIPGNQDKVPLAVRGAPTLVSNTGQTDDPDASLNLDHAQAFRTGSHASGYTLSSVVLELDRVSTIAPPTYTVKIHSNDASADPDEPDSSGELGTLTQVGDLTFDSNNTPNPRLFEFKAPSGGISLSPNTDYWVVLDVTAGQTETVKAGRCRQRGGCGRHDGLDRRRQPPLEESNCGGDVDQRIE